MAGCVNTLARSLGTEDVAHVQLVLVRGLQPRAALSEGASCLDFLVDLVGEESENHFPFSVTWHVMPYRYTRRIKAKVVSVRSQGMVGTVCRSQLLMLVCTEKKNSK